MKRVTKYCQNWLLSNPSLIKAELASVNSENLATDFGLTTWQRAVLTSRLGDYKADPAQGESWDSAITELRCYAT
ncbi:MAG: addiction module protein [Alishewanella aestuarii]